LSTEWTVDTLKEFFESEIASMRTLLNERYATQTKATDAASVVQQTAMKTAFDAADKAVQAALAAAKEASAKAEHAGDKRFDSVNEFREQLSDILARCLLRTEYVVSQGALTDKVESNYKALAERIGAVELRLTSRLDLNQGADTGATSARGINEVRVNQRLVVMGIIISVSVIAVNILVSLIGHHVL
jgi:hypothetical protein